MTVKRMRVFAGPNGSGKTTIFKGILNNKKINLGVYVNADEIEATLTNKKVIDFLDYQLNVDNNTLKSFFRESTFSPVKRNEPDLHTKLRVENNALHVHTAIDAYLSADIAEFIRRQLLANGISFTYETVMSHPAKIEFLKEAQNNGYRVYLYYIATEDPEININRVRVRVARQGHHVNPDVVRKRYYKSLSNLRLAVKFTDRAYIFDNSGEKANLIAEITKGEDIVMNTAVPTPNWFIEYLYNPSQN